MAGVNNLFTTEFYHLAKRRLRPGGVFCQWVQYYELSEESLRVIMDTLTSTFPHTLLFASHTLGDMFLIASDRPLELPPGADRLFPDRPAVSEDLARVGVRELSDLAILFTLTLSPPAKGAALNTDDNSFIQYRAPLDLLRGTEPANMGLRTSREDLERIFFPGRDENETLRDLGEAARR